MSLDIIRARTLGGVAHGFLGRRGGVSPDADLDIATGSQDAAENRRRAAEAVLPGARLVTLQQVHSADAIAVIAPYSEQLRPRADALVTATPGLVLGIVTADCAPVLFADKEAGVVAAAHAGWKGALGGVTDSTLSLMETLGARRERIAAAIGPCIARASYEVDEGFFARFGEADPANERFFANGKPGHYQFDLEAYVTHRLAAAGVTRVEALGRDTYADATRFFSFRRATHRAQPDTGRQISLIGLAG